MSMKRILTQREEAVMQILWRLKKAFVNDILEELPTPKPPYNTISSVVRKLVAEGLVGFQAYGNTHQYFPILKKHVYRRRVLGKIIREYFSDSPQALLSHFAEEQRMDVEELEALIKELKKKKS